MHSGHFCEWLEERVNDILLFHDNKRTIYTQIPRITIDEQELEDSNNRLSAADSVSVDASD